MKNLLSDHRRGCRGVLWPSSLILAGCGEKVEADPKPGAPPPAE